MASDSNQGGENSGGLREMAGQAAGAVKDRASQAADTVRNGVNQAADATRERLSKLRDDAGDVAHDASEKTQYAAMYADDAIERGTEALPTNGLVAAALGSIAISLVFKLGGRDRDAEFVGHWAPTFIGLAVLSKLTTHMKRDRR